MTSLAQRQAASTRPKAPARHSRPLTDDQRDILRDVWSYLVASAGEGQGVTASFKLHSFALRLCYPRAGKWSSSKPPAYQRYAHEPKLRPFTDAEKQMVFTALSGMKWDSDAGTWTLKRPIAEFAAQIGCGRTRINDALAAQRDSAFPILQIDSTPAFEREGNIHRGALRFSMIRDPLAFAEARDKARASRQTADDDRRKAMHVELVRLQIARERGELTPREFARRKAVLTHRIRWSSGETPMPLVAVDALPGLNPAPDDTPQQAPPADPAAVPLRVKVRRAAFEEIAALYPKAAATESDMRHRALERWELLAPTAALVDVIKADILSRVHRPRTDKDPDGWQHIDPRFVPDLNTYLRGELWKAGACV